MIVESAETTQEPLASLLVVDDEPILCRLMEKHLKRQGYSVQSTSDPEKAIDLLKEQEFEVVLTDIWMPNMTGTELLERIHQTAPSLKVILMTGQPSVDTAALAVRFGAFEYLSKPVDIKKLLHTVKSAVNLHQLEAENKRFRDHLEHLVEEKTRQLSQLNENYASILEAIPDMVLEVDKNGSILFANPAARNCLQIPDKGAANRRFESFIDDSSLGDWKNLLELLDRELESADYASLNMRTLKGKVFPAEGRLIDLHSTDKRKLYIARDISEQLKAEKEKQEMEFQLRQRQKLESIGNMASGIAHEINTPTQYVSDNIRFLKNNIMKLFELIYQFKQCDENMNTGNLSTTDQLLDIKERFKKLDLPFLLEEVPPAIEQSLEGINRVADIVSAMKEFSHPGYIDVKPVDLNKAIRSTVTVSRNEWKYVSEIHLDLPEGLLQVECVPSEINQVLLNLIVNATHAIQERRRKPTDPKGIITIQAKSDDEVVEITVSDNGAGIPDKIIDKIYDPFFTTKDVGDGSGKGLAFAYSIIVERHHGTIDVASKIGEGTIFTIRLPIFHNPEGESKDA